MTGAMTRDLYRVTLSEPGKLGYRTIYVAVDGLDGLAAMVALGARSDEERVTAMERVGNVFVTGTGRDATDEARAALLERVKRDGETRIREAEARLDAYLEAHAEADAHEEAMEDGGDDGD